MSPLPKPMSQRPTGMPQQRRKSGLRTAAGTLQEQFLGRLRDLRADPTVVLPEVVGDEPAPLAKLRRRLERMKEKGPSFMDRVDRGVLGAVARSVQMADLTAVPRLLDVKVAGQRRFFLVRGHIDRMALLGVQNHDEPRALALAYRAMAKKRGYHFFAGSTVWCTGTTPKPPQEWFDDLASDESIALEETEDGGRSCGHDDRSQALLTLRGGPTVAICAPCGKKAGHFHRDMCARYIGPNQRQPVDVSLRMPDGTRKEPGREPVARYRGGLDDEEALLRPVVAEWRNQSGRRFILGETNFHDQDAFLDALDCAPWERAAIAAMTQEGHVSAKASLSDVLDAVRPRMDIGVNAILGPGASEFIAERPGLAPRDLLRAASEEAEARRREAALPKVQPTGDVGRLLDQMARAQRRTGKPAAIALLRKALDARVVGRAHLWAFLKALGGDLGLEHRFQADERAAGDSLASMAKAALTSEGEAYADAVRSYLETSGSGETA